MTLVRRPSPFGELMTLRRAMDRLFDEDFFRSGAVAVGNGGPGTQGPGTQGPGTQGPGTQGPGTQGPGTGA